MRPQIENFHTRNLANGAHFTFMKNTIARAQADEHISTKCAKLLTICVDNFAEEDAVLKVSQKSFLSDEIAQLDALRDELYRKYRKAVKGLEGFPVADMAEAAKILAQHIKDYNIDPADQLDKETGLLQNMLADLQGKFAEQVAKLSLTSVVEQLAETNEQLDAKVEQRESEYAERKVGAMAAARKKVDAADKDLVQVINALVILEGEADYAEFIKLQNQSIARYKREALGETTSGKKEDEEDEPTPTPEPVTPEITAVYQKEGGDPENPNRIERGEQTGVNYKGFTLKGQDGTLEHVIGLVNDQDYIEWIKPETISNVTETSCEFTMVPDLTEGQYKVRIETYDGGSPLVVEYPEPIKLW